VLVALDVEESIVGQLAKQTDGVWLAAGFQVRSAEAELELICDDCGWSKSIAAGDWETR
jgi:hypothetical protein